MGLRLVPKVIELDDLESLNGVLTPTRAIAAVIKPSFLFCFLLLCLCCFLLTVFCVGDALYMLSKLYHVCCHIIGLLLGTSSLRATTLSNIK